MFIFSLGVLLKTHISRFDFFFRAVITATGVPQVIWAPIRVGATWIISVCLVYMTVSLKLTASTLGLPSIDVK